MKSFEPRSNISTKNMSAYACSRNASSKMTRTTAAEFKQQTLPSIHSSNDKSQELTKYLEKMRKYLGEDHYTALQQKTTSLQTEVSKFHLVSHSDMKKVKVKLRNPSYEVYGILKRKRSTPVNSFFKTSSDTDIRKTIQKNFHIEPNEFEPGIQHTVPKDQNSSLVTYFGETHNSPAFNSMNKVVNLETKLGTSSGVETPQMRSKMMVPKSIETATPQRHSSYVGFKVSRASKTRVKLDASPEKDLKTNKIEISNFKELAQSTPFELIKQSLSRVDDYLKIAETRVKNFPLSKEMIRNNMKEKIILGSKKIRILNFGGVTVEDYHTLKIVPPQSFDCKYSKEFIETCRDGNLKKVQIMATKIPQLVFEYDNIGMTGLAWACKKGHTELAYYLMSKKAYVEKGDLLRRTPLYYAVKAQNFMICKELLRRLANPWSITGLETYEVLCEYNREIGALLSLYRNAFIQRQMAPNSMKQQVWERMTSSVHTLQQSIQGGTNNSNKR